MYGMRHLITYSAPLYAPVHPSGVHVTGLAYADVFILMHVAVLRFHILFRRSSASNTAS